MHNQDVLPICKSIVIQFLLNLLEFSQLSLILKCFFNIFSFFLLKNIKIDRFAFQKFRKYLEASGNFKMILEVSGIYNGFLKD